MTRNEEQFFVVAAQQERAPTFVSVYWRYALIGLGCLVAGYFAGREHLKYELRTAVQSAMQSAKQNIEETFKDFPRALKSEPLPEPERVELSRPELLSAPTVEAVRPPEPPPEVSDDPQPEPTIQPEPNVKESPTPQPKIDAAKMRRLASHRETLTRLQTERKQLIQYGERLKKRGLSGLTAIQQRSVLTTMRRTDVEIRSIEEAIIREEEAIEKLED